MLTPIIIFGTIGLLFLFAHIWLRRSLERERMEDQDEDLPTPDLATCKVLVLEAIEQGDERIEKGGPGGISDPVFSAEARELWHRMPEEVRDFFERYPHGVSWQGLGHIGGEIQRPRLPPKLAALLKPYPAFSDILSIGGAEAVAFVVSTESPQIGCINGPLERVDFYASLYELIYSSSGLGLPPYDED